MDKTPVACDSCVHLVRKDGDRCYAYPDGIPTDIMLFGMDAHTSLRGDEVRPVTWKLDPQHSEEHQEFLHFFGG